jgi:DNA invertase Pin-like site-specific DNA recombinase
MLYITYYRVSTQRQGKSGLGLDAQKTQTESYVKTKKGEVIGSYTEIESGKNNARPELRKAINHAKQNGAILLVAKLDRLSRDVSFIFALKSELDQARIDFEVCDMPEANTLTLGIMSALAQHEREMISKRTKAGLMEAKKRGTKLGSPQNLTQEAREKGRIAITQKAINHQPSKFAYHFIKSLKEKGQSYQQITDSLNAEGYTTTEGKAFHPAQARRIFLRFDKK